jgi:hypothetical protein
MKRKQLKFKSSTGAAFTEYIALVTFITLISLTAVVSYRDSLLKSLCNSLVTFSYAEYDEVYARYKKQTGECGYELGDGIDYPPYQFF